MSAYKYIGHPKQISGVEEVILAKGKGKGMTLLEVTNGCGLEFKLSVDRAMDIAKLSFEGVNMGFFSPCGYVAPTYYDNVKDGFLKSFTAGFMTTCGLTAVGSPCIDNGEALPLHGSISNTPCEWYSYREDDNEIIIDAKIRDAALFANKLLLNRKYICSKKENILIIEDCTENIGTNVSPYMILYHFNIGYPLLSENAEIFITSNSCIARNEHAQKNFKTRLIPEKPQPNYEECCYYYDIKENNGIGTAGIFNADINKGLIMSFCKNTLDCFTEWKMMGEGEYVLGLEPANCTPDGRDVCRKKKILKFIKPGEVYKTRIKLNFIDKSEEIKCLLH